MDTSETDVSDTENDMEANTSSRSRERTSSSSELGSRTSPVILVDSGEESSAEEGSGEEREEEEKGQEEEGQEEEKEGEEEEGQEVMENPQIRHTTTGSGSGSSGFGGLEVPGTPSEDGRIASGDRSASASLGAGRYDEGRSGSESLGGGGEGEQSIESPQRSRGSESRGESIAGTTSTSDLALASVPAGLLSSPQGVVSSRASSSLEGRDSLASATSNLPSALASGSTSRLPNPSLQTDSSPSSNSSKKRKRGQELSSQSVTPWRKSSAEIISKEGSTPTRGTSSTASASISTGPLSSPQIVSSSTRDSSTLESTEQTRNQEDATLRPPLASTPVSTGRIPSPQVISSPRASSTFSKEDRLPVYGQPPSPQLARRSFSPFVPSDVSDAESQHSGVIKQGGWDDYDDDWVHAASRSSSVAVGSDTGGLDNANDVELEESGTGDFRESSEARSVGSQSAGEEPVLVGDIASSPFGVIEEAHVSDGGKISESERSVKSAGRRDFTPGDTASLASTRAGSVQVVSSSDSESGDGIETRPRSVEAPLHDIRRETCARPALSPVSEEERETPVESRSRSLSLTKVVLPPIKLKPLPTPPPRQPKIYIKGRKRGRSIAQYNRDYIELLNKDIRQVKAHQVHDQKERYGSFVLGSWWTPEEKNKFFNYLSTAGQDSVDVIAKGVGTKTVLECRAYIMALREGHVATNHWVRARGRDTVTPKDIPAAAEISEACEEELEKLAVALEARTLRDSDIAEKKKYGPFWRMDIPMAWQIQSLYESDDIDGIKEISPEAELLDVSRMLELSECIFMNGPPDRSWHELGQEQPSMQHTALSDIHKLVVSITRRLVQMSIFTAQSRIRNTDDIVFHPQPVVRSLDVKAALDIENMPLNSKDYWTYLPRRAGIHVVRKLSYIKLRGKPTKPRHTLPYNTVEGILAKVDKEHIKRFGQQTGDVSSETLEDEEDELRNDAEEPALRDLPDLSDEDEHSENGGGNGTGGGGEDADIDSDDVGDEDENQVYFRSRARRQRFEKMQLDVKKEEALVETIDAKASRSEEKKLWRLMGLLEEPLTEDEGEKVTAETEAEIDKPPKQAQHVPRPVLTEDWRQGLHYRAPWERTRIPPVVQLEEKVVFSTDEKEDGDEGVARRVVKRRKITKSKSKGDIDSFPADALDQVVRGIRPQMVEVMRSPRKLRARRKSRVFEGLVSTVEAVGLDDDEGDDEGGGAGERGGKEGDTVMRDSSSTGSEYGGEAE